MPTLQPQLLPSFDVLRWLLPRRAAISFLQAGLNNKEESAEFSRDEAATLSKACSGSTRAQAFPNSCTCALSMRNARARVKGNPANGKGEWQ